MARTDPLALAWAAQVLGDNDLQVVRGMREGYSPWLLRAPDREVVLREGQPGGLAARAPLILMERVPGSSLIPVEPEAARLAALGAVAARLHAVPLEPSADLPVRSQPIADVDFAAMRRAQEPRELLERGAAVLAAAGPTSDRHVFVHGDLWHGNTLWAGGQLTGLLDWAGDLEARRLRAESRQRPGRLDPRLGGRIGGIDAQQLGVISGPARRRGDRRHRQGVAR